MNNNREINRKEVDYFKTRDDGFIRTKTNEQIVSIITVCLNSEKFLEQTIQSVISQSYDNIEYIIIDGGSSDKTVEIIKKYERFLRYWVSEPDKGIYDAMNKGVSHARGEWIGIINSDDWYTPKAVEWIIKTANENSNADVIYGDVMHCEEDGTFRRVFGSHENLLENPTLPHPSLFVKKKIYDKSGYDIKFRINADYDLFLRLKKDNMTFVHVDVPIAFFRRSGISNKPALKPVIDRYIIRKRYDKKKPTSLFFRDMIDYVDDVLYSNNKKVERALKEHELIGCRLVHKALKIGMGAILRFTKKSWRRQIKPEIINYDAGAGFHVRNLLFNCVFSANLH